MSDRESIEIFEATAQPAGEESASPERPAGLVSGVWGAFTTFRRTRPLIGAVILAYGGYAVMQPMLGASFTMVVHMGMRGATPYLLGGIMILAAVTAVVVPAQRHFPAIIAMACAVLALPFANLGGWLIGTVCGIIGAGLVFAWTPYSDKQLAKMQARAESKRARKQAHKVAHAA